MFAILMVSVILFSQIPFFYSLIDDHKLKEFFVGGGKLEIILFFGRRRFTTVQLPYLLQNRRFNDVPFHRRRLVSKVNVIVNTADADDNLFLKGLSKIDPYFFNVIEIPRFIFNNPKYKNGKIFCTFYQVVCESGVLYIKIDDDIVYFSPESIFHLATTKLSNSSNLFISANIVNHPIISGIHQDLNIFNEEHIYEVTSNARKVYRFILFQAVVDLHC